MDQLSLTGLNYDILRHICVLSSSTSKECLKNLSRASKHLRDVAIPFIFEAVTISGDWSAALDHVTDMENNAGLLSHVKCCTFSPLIQDSQQPPPTALPLKLARAIGRMTRLERLKLFIPEYHTSHFEAPFRQEIVFLPRVDYLAVGPYSDFVVPLCPNVTTVATSSYQWLHFNWGREEKLGIPKEYSLRLIKAAGGASKLTHLAMYQRWNVGHLEAILAAAPGLSSLSMECNRYSDDFTELLPILSRFKNLQSLALASVFCLRVIDFEPPRCLGFYDGPGGVQLCQRIADEQEKATKLVVEMVFPVCRNLEVLWIIQDKQKAKVRRFENGDVAGVTWTEGTLKDLCE